MNLHNINVIAGYEVKLLKRSWLFRIFAILVLLLLTILQLGNISPLFWKYQETWAYSAVSSLIPFFTTYLYNIAQSVIVIFLAGSFLKRDKKLDTAEVIYVRPMSNADYIVGKVWGILRVFIGLNLITLLISVFINVAINRSPFSATPYIFYILTISLPSLLFILGLSFTMMCLLKNQAVTFIMMLGITGTIFFYLPEELYGVFDFFGVNIPAIFSDAMGHADLGLFLWQRSVYFLLGIGLICFTITLMRRLPHRPWKSILLNITGTVLVLIGCGLGFTYVLHFKNIAKARLEFADVYNKYAGEKKAKILFNDLTVEQHGKQLEGESRMELLNDTPGALKQIILYLNPALKVTSVQAGGKELAYTRNEQVILIDKELLPQEKLSIVLKYSGGIDPDICYTDVDDKDFLANTKASVFEYRYGKRYVYLDNKFTLLTPECVWYPVTEPPVYPAVPYNVRKNFTLYTLNVKGAGSKTVVSQGDQEVKDGVNVFVNRIPLPGISLTIADYEKQSVTVDSTDYILYYFPGHDFFSKYFTNLKDTLPSVIREIRNDLEVSKNRSYPFNKFILAEAPLQFTGYVRNWKGYTEQVMPEIIFVPERGISTRSDFRASKIQTRDWGRQDDVLDDKDIEIQVFRNYIQSAFVSETGGSMRFSQSPEVNRLNIGPMFYGFTGYISSADYPVMDVIINTMQSATGTSPRRWFDRSLDDRQRANIYLQDKSFGTALADREVKPSIFYEILKAKSNFFKNYIIAQVPLKEFNAFMKEFNDGHLFEEISFADFTKAFQERFGIDLLPFVKQWYSEDHSPMLTLKDVDANKVLVDDFTKYQVRFKVYNSSDVDAIITVKLESGGGGSGGFRMGGGPGSNNSEDDALNYIIPAKSAREIKAVNDDRPGRLVVNMNVSNNLPNEFTFNFSKVDNEISDTTQGIYVIDTLLFAKDPNEIIVDNEDAGFRTIEANQRNKLKDIFKKEEEDKYKNFFPWRFPSKWTAVVNNTCYGSPINSAVYKSKGKGGNQVVWTAELPKDNYYEVFIWNPKFDSGFMSFSSGRGGRGHGRENRTQDYIIKYDMEEEKVSVDLGQEENTWVSLGSFYLPKGEVTVTLTDKVGGQYVVADAVKFTMLKGGGNGGNSQDRQ